MSTKKITLTSALSFLVITFVAIVSSSHSISLAQNDLTATPEATRVPADADLYEDFKESLDYETGPGYSPDQTCNLPCWWGMTPGITSEEDVITILESTSFYRNWDLTEYGIPFDSSDEPVGGTLALDVVSSPPWGFEILFVADKGILDYMKMRIVEPNLWLPTNMFDLATIIAQVDSDPVIYMNNPPFHLLTIRLIYEEEGIVITYVYDFLQNEERYGVSENNVINSFQICSNDEIIREINVELRNPNGEEAVGQSSYESPYVDPIEDWMDTDSQSFVNFFKENPDDCLELELSSKK